MSEARTFVAAALVGAIGVLLGAFAAHGLKGRLSPEDLQVFETGVRYQMYHAPALLLCGLLARSGRPARASAWCFLLGVAVFSGSLYLLATTGVRWLGAITPIGGLALVLGWIALIPAGRQPAG